MTLQNAWYIGPALLALAGRTPIHAPFERSELEQLCTSFRRRTATFAIDHLRLLGFVAVSKHLVPPRIQYVLTPQGVEAARAAALAQARNSQAEASAFARRLWALMRARGQLTPVEAAELLTDAGEQDAESVRSQAAYYLRSWAHAHPAAIQVSAKRVGGAKRYVLLQDLGPVVPAIARLGAKMPAVAGGAA